MLMAMSTTLRRLLVSGGVLVAALLLLVAIPAAAQSGCSLTVSPRSGPPGTQFVFTGKGFTSDSMTLTRKGETPRTLPLTEGDKDPFTVKLIGGDGDVGAWRAVAAGCKDPATFRVNLPSTATIADAQRTVPPDRTPALLAFALLSVVFLGASAFLLPRVAGTLRAR